jgi:hypothetical protein
VQSFYFDFAELDTEPEVVVLFKLLSTFGSLPDALIKHVDDAKAGELLTGLWQAVKENEVDEHFATWTDNVYPNITDEAKRLIARMTQLDPAKRAVMSDIVEDIYWIEDVKLKHSIVVTS